MLINLHPARKFAHHKKLLAADVNEAWRRYAIQALLEKDEFFEPEHNSIGLGGNIASSSEGLADNSIGLTP